MDLESVLTRLKSICWWGSDHLEFSVFFQAHQLVVGSCGTEVPKSLLTVGYQLLSAPRCLQLTVHLTADYLYQRISTLKDSTKGVRLT